MNANEKNASRIRGKVLLVDDDELILNSYKRFLKFRNYEVITSTNAHEAVSLLGKNNFDVVVSDIAMPMMDGLELLQAVRQCDPDIPVILITGGAKLETAMQAVNLGALKYLLKPVELEELEELIALAIQKHNLAKAKREALAYLNKSKRHIASHREQLEANFERAMESLWIAYQPIISWKEKTVWGYEALVRSKEDTLLSPRTLFHCAEELDHLFQLSSKIRTMIAEQSSSIPADAKILVNIHPKDLLDENLYQPDTPFSSIASRVLLEVTERASLSQISNLQERIDSLRELGFGLAIDDLGAGYSGLSAFPMLQPNLAKIDLSLVRNVNKDETKQRLIGAMLEVCTELEIPVVLEGVETEEERDTLVEIGCDLLQGFLFAKPRAEIQSVDI